MSHRKGSPLPGHTTAFRTRRSSHLNPGVLPRSRDPLVSNVPSVVERGACIECDLITIDAGGGCGNCHRSQHNEMVNFATGLKMHSDVQRADKVHRFITTAS